MALIRRTDGTGAANLVDSTWWNTYYDLLTGAMTDQYVTLKYAPASNANGIPALKLLSSTGTPLVQGVKPDGTTQAFKFDENGNLTAGTVTAGNVTDNGNRVAVQGSHSSGQPIISWGTGQPAALAANEIFIQFS